MCCSHGRDPNPPGPDDKPTTMTPSTSPRFFLSCLFFPRTVQDRLPKACGAARGARHPIPHPPAHKPPPSRSHSHQGGGGGGSQRSQQLAAKTPSTQIRAQSLNTDLFPGTDNARRAEGAAPHTSTAPKGEGSSVALKRRYDPTQIGGTGRERHMGV